MYLTDTVLARVPSMYTVDVDGEAIVLDEVGGGLHVLNATAAIIWACLDGESTLDDIVLDLSDVLGEPHDRIAADVTAIAERFIDDRLVTNTQAAVEEPSPSEAVHDASSGCGCHPPENDTPIDDAHEAFDSRYVLEPANP